MALKPFENVRKKFRNSGIREIGRSRTANGTTLKTKRRAAKPDQGISHFDEESLSEVESAVSFALLPSTHHIFFLSLTSVELALSRVRERVLRGGHDVPEAVVRRRFDRAMQNFLGYYRRLANDWILFDNSGRSPQTVALAKGEQVRIINNKVHSALVKRYGEI